MLKVSELQFGYSDAENYRRRENKELLNRVFIRNQYLDQLCDPSISFLIGEKGTGKTAYAVFLSNNEYKNTIGSIRYIRETEYKKFISLKTEKHLDLSDYTSIWKVIIYLLLSQQIIDREGGIEFLKRFSKIATIQKAIDEYYNRAFSPEIVQALQFVKESKTAADLLSKYAKLSGEESESLTFSEARFQTNLFYIQRSFEKALSQARLNRNYILFIDGIDIRPSSVPYQEYLDCIKGLANAVWEVNNDFFPTVKGGGGRLRVVLLVRPDIFASLGLQNQNTKSRDNSVFLDWRTEYSNFRKSDLFLVCEHLLSCQQIEDLQFGATWDYYFPWDAPRIRERFTTKTSFLSFLRWSYYRPRDIITMLIILQDLLKEDKLNHEYFPYEIFDNAIFKRQYSDYLLGEIKDHLIFYYGADEYEIFLKFFEFLNGKNKFNYDEYIDAFRDFRKIVCSDDACAPQFMTNPSLFLQFLYDLNVICFIDYPKEDIPYFRWCFRMRSYSNISPKVKENSVYEIFYGLHKALNVGQEFVRRGA